MGSDPEKTTVPQNLVCISYHPSLVLRLRSPGGPTTPDLILIALHTTSHLTSPNLVLSHQTAPLQRLRTPSLPGPTLPSSFLQQLGQLAGGLKCLVSPQGPAPAPGRGLLPDELGKHDEAGPKTGRLKKAGPAPSPSQRGPSQERASQAMARKE